MFRPNAAVVFATVLVWTVVVPTLTQASPYADFVVSFVQGTGGSAGYTNSSVVLGASTASATIDAAPFANSQIVSLGLNGTLVVGFNQPIANDPNNPFGVDFLIFNNAFFTKSGANITGAFIEPAQQIWVSQDNVVYYQLNTTRGADDLFPTQGNGNATKPVDPSLALSNFTGNTVAAALTLYNGSAGGAPFDISSAMDTNGSPVILADISYVKVVNTSSSVTGEIDAFADVAPIPEPATILLVGGSLVAFALKRRRKFTLAVLLAGVAASATLATSLTENFSADPSNTWTFGVGDNSNNQFTWTNGPPAYTGDVTGQLHVHLNSSLPTARFQRSLGVTVTDTNDFTLTTRFSFNIISAPDDTAAQIAFGLVNSSLTGSTRTISPSDAFHTVEFNYFPQVSPTYGFGRTLTPVVFGAQKGDTNAFNNFAVMFDAGSDLGDNTNGVIALPQNVTLEATLAYNGSTKLLALTISQVNSNGTLTPLDTGVPPMDLVALGYDTNFPFKVDTLAIMAYQDAFTTVEDPSLVADLQFQKFDFTTSASGPQPPSCLLINVVSTNVILTFPTISDSFYYVQSRTNLAYGSWSTVASNIVGTGGIITNIDVGGAAVPSRFYRVGLVVP